MFMLLFYPNTKILVNSPVEIVHRISISPGFAVHSSDIHTDIISEHLKTTADCL